MANSDKARQFIAAALCDFVGYLDNLDSPIIVGGSYPKDLLVKQFNKWCKLRNFSIENPDGEEWLKVCSAGSLMKHLETDGREEHASPQ